MTRTLIGGVGYAYLGDFSLGCVLARELEGRSWPPGVTVRDLSYSPLVVARRLRDAEPPVDRMIVVGAKRRDRPPGSVVAYRWDGTLPDPETLQARVAEAVTGILDLDNLVLVPRAVGVEVPEVVVVEVEPGPEEPGEAFSPPVQRAVSRVRECVVRLATDAGTLEALSSAALGGGVPEPEAAR